MLAGDEASGGFNVTNAQARGEFERWLAVAATGVRCGRGGQQSVRDFGHGGDNDDWREATATATFDNGDGAVDGNGIFNRGATELHHDNIWQRGLMQ